MSAPARFRKADIKRALSAARESGYEDARVRIGVDGGIEIIVGKAANDSPEPVELK
ncbi:MAG: hypothetical protein J7496_08795 [Novosphingobium sp.]|nr:hypothetical protein [Novosphingobium sp.]